MKTADNGRARLGTEQWQARGAQGNETRRHRNAEAMGCGSSTNASPGTPIKAQAAPAASASKLTEAQKALQELKGGLVSVAGAVVG